MCSSLVIGKAGFGVQMGWKRFYYILKDLGRVVDDLPGFNLYGIITGLRCLVEIRFLVIEKADPAASGAIALKWLTDVYTGDFDCAS